MLDQRRGRAVLAAFRDVGVMCAWCSGGVLAVMVGVAAGGGVYTSKCSGGCQPAASIPSVFCFLWQAWNYAEQWVKHMYNPVIVICRLVSN